MAANAGRFKGAVQWRVPPAGQTRASTLPAGSVRGLWGGVVGVAPGIRPPPAPPSFFTPALRLRALSIWRGYGGSPQIPGSSTSRRLP